MLFEMSNSRGIEINVFEKEHIIFDREIGYGSFGKVYTGGIANTHLSQVAIKVFFKEIKNRGVISPADKEKAYEELLKVAVIDHENIVKLHGMVQDDLPWLIFEYMKDGNLLEHVRKSSKIKEKELIHHCRDICSGMVFLHNNQILHKDLAARNILLSGKTAKIADLGLSSFLTNNDEGIYALNGKLFPYRHAAVECIVEQLFTYESDVWSFGVLMYEIFTGGSTPYGKENREAEVRRLIVDHITPMHIQEPRCSTKVHSLMKSALNPALRERPTFSMLQSAFEKLNGKTKLTMKSQNNENISLALSAFHKMKSNGLSSSINNLNRHLSSSSSSSSLTGGGGDGGLGPTHAVRTNGGLLTVTPFNNDTDMFRSSSTPDIINELESADAYLHLSGKLAEPNNNAEVDITHPYKTPNKLTVRMQFGIEGRRHSADLLPRNPLRSEFNANTAVRHERGFESSSQNLQTGNLSMSPVTGYLDDARNAVVEEQRSRVNSGSRIIDDSLMKGFVQNRFSSRRTKS